MGLEETGVVRRKLVVSVCTWPAPAALAAGLFWAFGALLSICLFQVLKSLGFARWGALGTALAFPLLPQTLFPENLYLYT